MNTTVMKLLVVIVVFAGLCTSFAELHEGKTQWLSFKTKHAKTYSNIQEEKRRFSIFQQNLKTINEHNALYEAGKTTYKMGVNKFSDMTEEEYFAILKRSTASRPQLRTGKIHDKFVQSEIPESIDWRDKGAVSGVKDQGVCGMACWAFSAIGTVESFYYLKNNTLVTFSEQQLIDCDTQSDGCRGGYVDLALGYIQEYGIFTEDSYPYVGTDSNCNYSEDGIFLKIKDYVEIPSGDEDGIKNALGSLGAISVALNANHLSHYSSGVFTDNNCDGYTNHAVLAVGYGHDKKTGLDYWLVKNSWGEDWGEQGYFKIKRGTNECLIATEGVYPVL